MSLGPRTARATARSASGGALGRRRDAVRPAWRRRRPPLGPALAAVCFRRRPPLGPAVAAVCCSIAGIATLAGCPSSASSLPYTPYTGINVDSAEIVQGAGCGTAESQIYKYVVVVADPTDSGAPSLSPLSDGGVGAWAGLFDCWTNAVFAAITTSPNGSSIVEAWVYAYDQADFQAAQASVPGFASCSQATCPLSVADAQAVVRSASTYTTTCTANPEGSDNVVASCLPLAPHGLADAGASRAPGDAADEAPGDFEDAAPGDADAGDAADETSSSD